ncbi:MAG: GAF domain-containing sensor histidine kinase [Bacteroidota bacterium]
MERILDLSELDLDYSGLSENLKDLTHLAAKVAGTDISLVNLIDSYTQWTVANHGLDIAQMPRDESVCQHTIMTNNEFEVGNLSLDPRFSDQPYVKGPLALRYYFGVPLTSREGVNLGALCVLDTKQKDLNPEKIEMLKIIANEVANRIKTYGTVNNLRQRLEDANKSKAKVAHDIRGPLAGIIGLSEIAADQGNNTSMDDILEFIKLIHKSSRSILELADEILTEDKQTRRLLDSEFNLSVFKEKLIRLYLPQAQSKGVKFEVNLNEGNKSIPFSRNKLLQIAGNLISNAIKFTPPNGIVTIDLDLRLSEEENTLTIKVSDTGQGMPKEVREKILRGDAASTDGTSGEIGYGFGLALVKHLIDSLKGSLSITSSQGNGSMFKVGLPQKSNY